MRIIFAKSPKIKTLSHKLLLRQTSNHHQCNWHAQEPICMDFQVISSHSSWSKITLYIFKEQIWFQIANAVEKINSFLIPSVNREKLFASFSFNTLCRWLTVGDSTLCAGLTTDDTTFSCRNVGHSWTSSLWPLHFVNICPQQHWWHQ